MTTTERKRHPRRIPSGARGRRAHPAGAGRRVSEAINLAGRSVARLVDRIPGTMRATRSRAQGTTSALQTLPDSTLRWLAASSVGLGAGFYLARAPRLIIAAGVAPAVIMGAAIAMRPIEPER